MAPRNRNDNRRSASSEGDYTRADLEREFPNDAAALDWLWRENCSADGEHAECPKCERERRFHRVASRPSYSCDTCGHHIHPTAGTIFHKSSTGLDLWFRAVFLMSSTRCGISAKQLERDLGVTYKTAWRMFTLIRNELMTQDEDTPLDGDVEADETYIGGKPRAGKKLTNEQHIARKAAVMAAVERGGKVRATVMPSARVSGPEAKAVVTELVKADSRLYTDESNLYFAMDRMYDHHTINHKAAVYARGHVHTQTIEGFFSTLKNGIHGAHHAVSHKYLQGYLNEYVFRYNHRDDREPMFKTLLRLAAAS